MSAREFHVIASSGHAGTKWLATVLNERPEWVWTHEELNRSSGLDWTKAELLAPGAPEFAAYWTSIEIGLMWHNVGDSNSWSPHLLPAVHAIRPIDRVLYLHRGEEEQAAALAFSPVLRKAREYWPPAVWRKVRCLAELSPYGHPPIHEISREEAIALMVAAGAFMPDWLRAHGLTVEEVWLEELTTLPAYLARLAPELERDEIVRWQGTVINHKERVYG